MNRIQVACWLAATLPLGCSGKLVVDESEGAAGADGGWEGEPACMGIVSHGYPCEREGRECAMTVVDCSGGDSRGIHGIYQCTDGAWVLISEPTEVEVDDDWCDDEFAGPGATGGAGGAAGAGAGPSRPVPPPGCDGVITFADPTIDAAVRNMLPVGQEDIRHEDIWMFTELDLSDAEISDLRGVECMTGLSFIKIQYAAVSDLTPLSGLEELRFLGLAGNQISDLSPLAGLTTLSNLYLENNLLTDLSPVAGLTELTHLSAGGNEISDLSPVTGLTSLEWLFMYNAKVSDLTPLVQNEGIGDDDRVNLSSNPIDCDEQAANVQALRERGVNLSGLCPNN